MKSFARFVPRSIKNLVPGYRSRWRDAYRALLAEIAELHPSIEFGQTGDTPWIELKETGLRLHGFWTEGAELELYENLRPDLPAHLPRTHFRLCKDFINRYRYPHLRPDLKPQYPREQLHGFHGQHKDALVDLPDSSAVESLTELFRPKLGEIIIDGGAFLGFGDIRVAAEVGNGHIYAIEAARSCHTLLRQNVEFNKVANVTPIHRAVWKENGTMNLGTTYAQGNSLVPGKVHGFEPRLHAETVGAVTIDTVVDEFGLHRVDMLSFTLNGAEPEAVMGAQNTLRRFRPRFRAPGRYLRGNTPISEMLRELLTACGYRVFAGQRGNTIGIPL